MKHQSMRLNNPDDAGGSGRLVAGLCDGMPVRYNSVVSGIRYCAEGVLVDSGSQQFPGEPRISFPNHIIGLSRLVPITIDAC